MLLAGLLLAVSLWGCADLDPASPGAVDTGSADFTRYVALGNSLTAGYQSGGLVEKYQRLSYPALIARAAGVMTFEMPLISEPGIPFTLFVKNFGPVELDTLQGQGTPINLNYPGIYNNLGIPGAKLNDLLTVGPLDQTNPYNPFFSIVLRDPGLGANALEQAINLQPTFVTVWIGSNDVLGSAFKGTDAYMTPAASFDGDFRTLIDSLRAHADGIIAANVPDVVKAPYFTTIPTVLVDPVTRDTILNPANGQPIPLIGMVQGVPGPLPSDALLPLEAIGYISAGIGVPAAVGGTDIPLADSLVIDPVEKANIEARVLEYNTIIDSICANRSIPVVDMYSFFDAMGSDGATIRGAHYRTDYIEGGLFSVDGLHPSSLGYYLIANEFIDRINASFNAAIPPAHIPVQ